MTIYVSDVYIGKVIALYRATGKLSQNKEFAARMSVANFRNLITNTVTDKSLRDTIIADVDEHFFFMRAWRTDEQIELWLDIVGEAQ